MECSLGTTGGLFVLWRSQPRRSTSQRTASRRCSWTPLGSSTRCSGADRCCACCQLWTFTSVSGACWRCEELRKMRSVWRRSCAVELGVEVNTSRKPKGGAWALDEAFLQQCGKAVVRGPRSFTWHLVKCLQITFFAWRFHPFPARTRSPRSAAGASRATMSRPCGR